MNKKLYSSHTNKMLTGLLGGIGEYFDIDPSVLRLAFVFLVVITGVFPFVIAYIIGAMIVPAKGE